MKKILETDRLILREFIPQDAEELYNLNKDPEVIRYTGDKPFKDKQEANDFLKSYKDYTVHGFGRWAVIHKDSVEFLGWCGLKINEEGHIDLGFRFFRREWNKGYATEAAKACLTYGFETIHMETIIGRAAKNNTASLRVLEKIGMKFWQEGTCHGITNAQYFFITKEWFNKSKSVPLRP